MEVNFDADRFQGGNPQQRFGIGFSPSERRADQFTHKLYLTYSDIKPEFAAISQAISAFPLCLRPIASKCCLGTKQSVAPVSTRKSPSQSRSGPAGFLIAPVP